MMVPTIIADDFFDNYKSVLEFANTLDYYPAPNGAWPGLRTKPLHEINYHFFNTVCKKIISLMYPIEGYSMQWNASSEFQKIKVDPKNKETFEGWVHNDNPALFTAIIYLSPHTDVGTSIVMPNSELSEIVNLDAKRQKTLTGHADNFKEKLVENNSQFQETIKVHSRQNRIFIFDSSQYHYVHNFLSQENKGERLTLICFFEDLHTEKGMRWGIPEMRKHRNT